MYACILNFFFGNVRKNEVLKNCT